MEAPLDGEVSLVKQRCSEESREFSSCRCPQVYGGILRNESRKLFKKYLEKNENVPEFVKNLALS